MMNGGVSVKNYMMVVLVKMIICEIPVGEIVNVIRHVKSMNI